MNRVAIKFCFKAGLSAIETLVLVQMAYGNEALKRWNVFRLYSRFRGGRELVEDDERGGRPKSNLTEGNSAAVADLVKKRPSNRIKNDSRIFKHPRDCSSSDSERGFWEEKVVCTFCSTLLDTWAKGRSESHLAKTLSRWPMQTKHFLTNYYGRWDLVFCPWPRNKATDFWMGWWDIPSAEESEIPKVRINTMLVIFFELSRRSAQRIRTGGKSSKCRIL